MTTISYNEKLMKTCIDKNIIGVIFDFIVDNNIFDVINFKIQSFKILNRIMKFKSEEERKEIIEIGGILIALHCIGNKINKELIKEAKKYLILTYTTIELQIMLKQLEFLSILKAENRSLDQCNYLFDIYSKA